MDSLPQLAKLIGEYFTTQQQIDRTTVASDINGWDSLAHASLIVTIEKDFGIRLAIEKVWGLTSVGDLADYVNTLLGDGGGS